eukprot:gb/GECG01006772.1/.p1 GENE.gb/GECG01006772.1/~~gb/GECG01006772.1/.p1  ORF type:complete len:1900 (+),score=212.10 gb/GECG01006772.1/:1-5700(+)
MGNKQGRIVSVEEGKRMLSSEVNDVTIEDTDNARHTLLARYEEAFYRMCGGGAVSSASVNSTSSDPQSEQVTGGESGSAPVQTPRMKDGTFTMYVLERFYRLMPVQLCQRLFKVFDSSNLGEICLDDFLCNIAVVVKGSEEQKARLLFQIYDSDNKGKLHLNSLIRFQQMIATNRRVSVRVLERQVEEIWSVAREVMGSSAVQDSESVLVEEWVAYCTDPRVQQNKEGIPMLSWLSSLSEALQPSKKMESLIGRFRMADRNLHCLCEVQSEDRSCLLSPNECHALYLWLHSLRKQSPRGILDWHALRSVMTRYIPESIAYRMYSICDPWGHGVLEESLFARLVSIACKGSANERTILTFVLFHQDPFLFTNCFEGKRSIDILSESWDFITGANAVAALHTMETATANKWIDPTKDAADSSALHDLQVKLCSSKRRRQLMKTFFPQPEKANGTISFEQFQAVVQNRNELVDGLWFVFSLLIRVDVGIRPESPDEENRIISSCHVEFDPLHPGEKGTVWYIIPKKWWNDWSTYVRNDVGTDKRHPIPGKIDNALLLDSNGVPRLKENLYANRDFKLVTERVWKALSRWYNGAPSLPRHVVLVPGVSLRSESFEHNGETLELELYPVVLVIRRYEPQKDAASGNSFVKNFSKYMSIEQLYDSVCTGTVKSARENTRLWFRHGPSEIEKSESGSKEKLSLEPGKFHWCPLPVCSGTLEQCELLPAGELLVEVRLKDGSWPLRGWSEEPADSNKAQVANLPPGSPNQQRGEEAFLGLGNDSDIEYLEEELTREEYRNKRAESVSQLLFVVNSALEYSRNSGNGNELSQEKGDVGSANNRTRKKRPSAACTRNMGDVKDCYNPSVRPRAGSEALSRHLQHKLQHYPGHVGLKNLGNTCFMNSSLQCLLNTRLLVVYFLSRRFVEDINTEAKFGHGGFMAAAFFELCMEVWTSQAKALAPTRFKEIVASLNPMFRGQGQHDAHEVLEFILNGLAEDLNRNERKPYIEQRDSDGRKDDVVAAEWWLTHLKRELSVVATLFSGQYKSTLVCDHCNQASCRFEPFTVLQVPLPSPQYRYIKILVVFWNNVRPPVYVSVRIQSQTTVKRLKKALEQCQPGLETGIVGEGDRKHNRFNPVPNNISKVRIRADELYVTRPYKVSVGQELLDSVVIGRNKEEDSLMAYQLPSFSSTRGADSLRRVILETNAGYASSPSLDETLHLCNKELADYIVKKTAPWLIDSVCVPLSIQEEIQSEVQASPASKRKLERVDSVNPDCSVGVSTCRGSRYAQSSLLSHVTLMEAFGASQLSEQCEKSPQSSEEADTATSGFQPRTQRESPGAPIHVVARHAKWERVANFFLDPLHRISFALPHLLRVNPDETTAHDLYVMVWNMSRRFIRRQYCPQSRAAIAAASHSRYLDGSGVDVKIGSQHGSRPPPTPEENAGQTQTPSAEMHSAMFAQTEWDPDFAGGVNNLSLEDVFDLWGFALKVVNRGSDISFPGADTAVDRAGALSSPEDFSSSSTPVSWAHASDGVLLRPYRTRTLGAHKKLFPADENFTAKTAAEVFESLAKALQYSSGWDSDAPDGTNFSTYLMDLGAVSGKGGLAFSEGTNIVIEWDPFLFNRSFDRQEAEEIQDHTSMILHHTEKTRAITLSQCLDSFSQWEYLDDEAFCKRCSRSAEGDEVFLRKHSKKLEIFRAPPVLIVQLKRFHDHVNDEARPSLHQKLTNIVKFPLERLNLDEFMAKPSISGPSVDYTYWEWLGGKVSEEHATLTPDHEASKGDDNGDIHGIHGDESDETLFRGVPLSLCRNNAVYDLYGVVNHHGAMGAGHYTAFVKSPISGEWLEYNDDIVMKRDASSVVTAAAYLLFYARRDMHTASLEQVFPPRSDGKEPVDLARIQKSMQSSKSCNVM